MDLKAPTTFLVVEASEGERVHGLLKANGWLEAHVEPLRGGAGTIGFPLAAGANGKTVRSAARSELGVSSECIVAEVARRDSVDPHHRLTKAVQTWLDTHQPSLKAAALVPTKWERLGDLALFPQEWRHSDAWPTVSQHPKAKALWEAMAEALKVTSLGVQAPIADDTFRSSQVEMLLGSSEVEFTDHGLTYAFDAAKVMFSSGNVTERRRIGAMNMQGEVVVDAYAGVGYYTFPMLVHAGAAHVHACEINPASIAGLRAGAAANDLLERLTVHEGDNHVTLLDSKGWPTGATSACFPRASPFGRRACWRSNRAAVCSTFT